MVNYCQLKRVKRSPLYPYTLDTDDMASAIARVMEDESMRQRMIEAGKKHAEPYTWASSCKQYFKLYEELIN